MKKLIGLATMLILAGTVIVCGHIETHYTREAVVVACENEIVSFYDGEYIWEAEGTATVGKNVRLNMYTNLTDNTVLDDEIVGWR